MCFSSDGAETTYYFTALALTLNEPEEGVAPTDSRLRPDQRLMEDGRWDEANAEKQRLEEKQRSVRREREREAASQRSSGQVEEGERPWLPFFCLCVSSSPPLVGEFNRKLYIKKKKNSWGGKKRRSM